MGLDLVRWASVAAKGAFWQIAAGAATGASSYPRALCCCPVAQPKRIRQQAVGLLARVVIVHVGVGGDHRDGKNAMRRRAPARRLETRTIIDQRIDGVIRGKMVRKGKTHADLGSKF